MSDQDIENFIDCHLAPALRELVDEAYNEQYVGWPRRKSTDQLKYEIHQMVAEKLKQETQQ